MKTLDNKVMLITYADSLGKNLQELKQLLDSYFSEAVGGLHILPFFPSSGDRGFAPLNYQQVDQTFGDWTDIMALAKDYYLMYDFMINHLSAESHPYQDFLLNKEASDYKQLFIRYRDFWQEGQPTEKQVATIYKRKPRAPYVEAHFADGSKEKVWCTFGDQQIDLDCQSGVGHQFIRQNLVFLAEKKAALIRLDAFAYAIKKADTSCFFVEPDIWRLLSRCQQDLGERPVLLLPEIHEHYTIQQKIAEHGYYVYDFALPMLLLNALYYGQANYLKHWFSICPRRQFTTLDTHDGIGVVDVRDLLPDKEVERTKEAIFKYGANVKRIYNTKAYNNLDIYQINCTYYSALGNDDRAYLLARAVQFFAPGIPQVYYVGLLAGKNDLALLETTKEGRNINRHYYSKDEVVDEVKRPVVKKLLELMAFRNQHPAFDGDFSLVTTSDNCLHIRRQAGQQKAELIVDFIKRDYRILYTENGQMKEWEGVY